MNNNSKTAYRIAAVGVMAALVFAATNLRLVIPTPIGNTMLHLGNVMCLLGGLLFGGIPGGLAAGIGSFFFDLFSEYASVAPITFCTKFMMGFVAGMVAFPRKGQEFTRPRRIAGAVAGAATYFCLYIAQQIITQRFILQVEWQTVLAGTFVKGLTSLANTTVAIVASLLLAEALIPALKKAGLLQKLRK